MMGPFRRLAQAFVMGALTLPAWQAGAGQTGGTSAGKVRTGQAIPPSGTAVVDGAAVMLAAQNNPMYETTIVPAKGPSFSRALRFRTKALAAQAWDVQVTAPTVAPVRKGDALLAVFWARNAGSTPAEAQTEFVFEQVGGSFAKSVMYSASAGRPWRQYCVPFKAAADYAPGEAHICFRLGYSPQTIDLAGVQVLDYGQNAAVSLPSSSVTYAGREANALWRKAAVARIDRYRKGDLRVIVIDRKGRPVPGAAVAVHMKRHAFGFGSAVVWQALLDKGPDGERYRETVKRLFNKVVPANELKWPDWESPGRGRALEALRWYRQNGIAVRGHNLVWPSYEYCPRDVEALKNDPAALRERVANHIKEEVSALKSQIVEWDVVNEPVTNHQLMDVLGQHAIVDWYKIAHQADPAARLFVNDYSILSSRGLDKAHQDALARVIADLKKNGAPLGGIGLQGHFDAGLTPPDRLISVLDRFSKYALPIEITEHDMDTQDEQLQADYTRDFMTAVFSHPGVMGILTWGFWEGSHWRPNGAYFRRDWSVKPAGKVWMDLVLKKWWTDVSGTTDRRGQYRTRGFQGDYVVEVKAGAKRASLRLTLPRSGATVRMAL